MSKVRVLVTSMGGGGSNNLVGSIRLSSLGKDVEIIGTHADKYQLAHSSAEKNYLVPYTKDEELYIDAHKKIISKESVDLIMPNSDKEVALISKYRNDLACPTFLPDHEVIEASQDKYSLNKILSEKDVKVAKTFDVPNLDNIESSMSLLPNEGKFWIRVRKGSGALAATWVETPQQAISWIRLWQELHGFDISQFILSEFLPGRVFEALTLWHKGELKVAKVYEVASYHGAEQRLSGMASTPEVAKTVRDQVALDALEESIKAVKVVSDHFQSKPNGIHELSIKENIDGVPCVTEINIGRFPMTSPFFDRTGKYITGELYIRYALEKGVKEITDPLDIEPEDIYYIRSLDREFKLIRGDDLGKYIEI